MSSIDDVDDHILSKNLNSMILVVDGLIGTGKSTLCRKIHESDNKNTIFDVVYETGQLYALSVLENCDLDNLKTLDNEYYCLAQKASLAHELLSKKSTNSKEDEVMLDCIRSFIDLSFNRWQDEIRGIFQNVMMCSSYAPLLSFRQSSIDKKDDKNRILLMDRDPKSNGLFYYLNVSQSNFSPVASYMYQTMYNLYSKTDMKYTYEIWLWCKPSTSIKRIYKRGRPEEQSKINSKFLWKFQSISLNRILLNYAGAIEICENDKNQFSKSISNSEYSPLRFSTKNDICSPCCKSESSVMISRLPLPISFHLPIHGNGKNEWKKDPTIDIQKNSRPLIVLSWED